MKLVVHHQGKICLEQLYAYESNNNLVTFDNGCFIAFEYGKYCYGENPNGVNIAFFNYQYIVSALNWLDGWSYEMPSRAFDKCNETVNFGDRI